MHLIMTIRVSQLPSPYVAAEDAYTKDIIMAARVKIFLRKNNYCPLKIDIVFSRAGTGTHMINGRNL